MVKCLYQCIQLFGFRSEDCEPSFSSNTLSRVSFNFSRTVGHFVVSEFHMVSNTKQEQNKNYLIPSFQSLFFNFFNFTFKRKM